MLYGLLFFCTLVLQKKKNLVTLELKCKVDAWSSRDQQCSKGFRLSDILSLLLNFTCLINTHLRHVIEAPPSGGRFQLHSGPHITVYCESFVNLSRMIPASSALHDKRKLYTQHKQMELRATHHHLQRAHTDHHRPSPHFLTLFLALPCLEPKLGTNWISSDPVDRLSEGLGYDLKRALLRGQTQPI